MNGPESVMKDDDRSWAQKILTALAEINETADVNRRLTDTLSDNIFGSRPEKNDAEPKDGHDPDAFALQVERYLDCIAQKQRDTNCVLERLNKDFVRG